MVAGVDEAGWGAWAGPLSVGAAIVPNDQQRIPKGLRDSKDLSERQREALFDPVTKWCEHWAVGHATHAECDVGLPEAWRLAADRALGALEIVPHYKLVDGDQDFVGTDNWRQIPKGDARSASIAAASILAKVIHDRIMCDLSPHFPGYDFKSNKGENSPQHKKALLAQGPSDIHRGNVKLRVRLRDLPMTGDPHHVRSEPAEPPSDYADYSQLSGWVDPNGVTRPSTVTG